MTAFKVTVDMNDRRIKNALRKAPGIMTKHLSRGVSRAAQEVAREERRAAPKAFSTLTQSIRVMRETPLQYSIAPGVEYASYVEEGTQGGAVPPERNLLDWIRVSRISPRDPNMTEEDLAYVIARSIAMKGTAPQPFVAPTAEKMQPRVHDIIRAAAQDGMLEIWRAGSGLS